MGLSFRNTRFFLYGEKVITNEIIQLKYWVERIPSLSCVLYNYQLGSLCFRGPSVFRGEEGGPSSPFNQYRS